MPTRPMIEHPMGVVYVGRLSGSFNVTGRITGMNYRVLTGGMAFTMDTRDFDYLPNCNDYRRVIQ